MTRPAKKHSRRRVLEVAAGAVVIALVFAYFLPKIADYSQVWAIVSTLSWPWILALVAASALFILSDAPPWLAVLPGLRFFDALRMDSPAARCPRSSRAEPRSTSPRSTGCSGTGASRAGALVGFGVHNAAAVAATLVYRALTFLPSVVLGLASAATYNLGRPKPALEPQTETR